MRILVGRTASRTIRRPPCNRAPMRAPPQQQDQKAKTRSGITIRSQSCRLKYRLSIRRSPNCKPRSKARRSMSPSATAAIESVTGKSNDSNGRRNGKTRSTRLPSSKTKPATTVSSPTRFPDAHSGLFSHSTETATLRDRSLCRSFAHLLYDLLPEFTHRLNRTRCALLLPRFEALCLLFKSREKLRIAE